MLTWSKVPYITDVDSYTLHMNNHFQRLTITTIINFNKGKESKEIIIENFSTSTCKMVDPIQTTRTINLISLFYQFHSHTLHCFKLQISQLELLLLLELQLTQLVSHSLPQQLLLLVLLTHFQWLLQAPPLLLQPLPSLLQLIPLFL